METAKARWHRANTFGFSSSAGRGRDGSRGMMSSKGLSSTVALSSFGGNSGLGAQRGLMATEDTPPRTVRGGLPREVPLGKVSVHTKHLVTNPGEGSTSKMESYRGGRQASRGAPEAPQREGKGRFRETTLPQHVWMSGNIQDA